MKYITIINDEDGSVFITRRSARTDAEAYVERYADAHDLSMGSITWTTSATAPVLDYPTN